MKDLCVPIPNFSDNEIADIELTLGGQKIKYNYRVVSFAWDDLEGLISYEDELTVSLARITRLKKDIESYDKNWELIQIFTPPKNASHIQVLYRMKLQK
jgi:hypothetical protein